MYEKLRNLIGKILAEKFAFDGFFQISPAPKFTGCDYATNAGRKFDENQLQAFREELLKTGVFEEVKFIPPFTNLKLKMDFLRNSFSEILEAKSKTKRKEKILIEFVSANPTGLLHIGHLRGAVIGDALSRILKESGFDVIKEYYVNDRGKQIDLLTQSIFAIKNKKPVPEGGYQGKEIEEIAEKIKDKSAEEIKEFAVACLLDEIKKDLKKIDIEFDSFFSEKKLYEDKKVDEILEILKKKNAVFEKEGALWLDVKEADEKDRVLVKSDGSATYFLSDIAYHYDKFKRAQILINIWGADHHGYVARVKKAISILGFNPENLKVILYQIVRLKRGNAVLKMSKRDGTYLLARDVIDEVGRDAVRFFLISRKADAQFDFDLELAKKKTNQNPVFYLQYAHARICSVFEKAKTKSEDFEVKNLNLLGEETRELLKKVCEFEDVLKNCVEDFSPHYLTVYLSELATLFHNFYEKTRVITDDIEVTSARLSLLKGILQILRRGLDLLGISAPEKM